MTKFNANIINDNIDIDYLADKIIRTSYYGKNKPIGKTAEDNDLTAKNCYNSGHLSVFEFLNVTFEVECPIWMARQLMRYRTFKYIEKSLRRSEPEMIDNPQNDDEIWHNKCVEEYKRRIANGCRKERARKCLDLDTKTYFIFSADLRNLFHMFKERASLATQDETRELVALMKSKLFAKHPRLQKIVEKDLK